MKPLAHWAIFKPSLTQIQRAFGRWVVTGFLDGEGRPYESGPVLIVGVLIPAPGVSLSAQVFVADSSETASSPSGYDWEILLDQVQYVRYVDAPIEGLERSL